MPRIASTLGNTWITFRLSHYNQQEIHCHLWLNRREWSARGVNLFAEIHSSYPAELGELLYSKEGKPHFANPEWQISISHTANHAVAVVCQGPKLGVDIELARERRFLHLARQYFHARESTHLQKQVGDEQRLQDEFYRLWTLKEALAKVTGKGLGFSIGQNMLGVSPTSLNGKLTTTDQSTDYRFVSTKLQPEIYLALAVKTIETNWSVKQILH